MAAPKLRFKEFDANWSLSSLGKMTTYFKGYAFKSESYKDSGIRVIRVSDLGRESIKTDNDSIYIDANNASAYENWIIKKDDIIITTVGSKPHLVDSAVGRPIYVKNNNEGLLNQNLLVLRPIDKTVDSYFIYAQLLDKKYLTHIELIQRGNANQSNITVKDLQDFETYITSKKEQAKIASFLSNVDEKISQLNQKHELLSQYKQGMMQKLFSQQIRFKADDGSEFGDWENISVKEIFDVTRGQVLAVSNTVSVADTDYKYPVFSSQTKQKGLMGFYKKYLFEDALTWTTDGANAGDVNFRKGKFYCTNVCGVLLSKKGYANLCIAEILNKVTHKYVSYVGNPKLMNNVMSEIPITIPSNLEEQTKIANFLSAIEQKIEVVTQQIEQAKTWKKGLLQQMFV
ncbi:restriction endonuclease subunit S [Acinetobacter sp. YH12255]|uniref:restriction endonuclease subunit S n=1 Tax=Acinetobacter sp. YH12255 TaxID=2601179 RepID=UPI0015D3C7C6|nr:restriction endonuclease subunit S [Acinetobacter sp. YH12255]